jgi:nitrous oxidase accessory protein NosD
MVIITLAAAGCGAYEPERVERPHSALDTREATLYVSATGDDGSDCASPERPCRTWAAAYIRASPGTVVELAAGDHGNVALERLERKGDPERVIFRPAKGATVKVGDLDVEGTNDIEIVGVISSEGWQIHGMAENVVMRDVKILDSEWGGYLGGARNVRVIGGEIGRIDPQDGLHLNNADGENTDIVIDGLHMHDLTNVKDPQVHTDCVQTGSANGLVIRNSRFINCGTQGLFLSAYGGGTTSDVVIENNWIGRGHAAAQLRGGRRDVRRDAREQGGRRRQRPRRHRRLRLPTAGRPE